MGLNKTVEASEDFLAAKKKIHAAVQSASYDHDVEGEEMAALLCQAVGSYAMEHRRDIGDGDVKTLIGFVVKNTITMFADLFDGDRFTVMVLPEGHDLDLRKISKMSAAEMFAEKVAEMKPRQRLVMTADALAAAASDWRAMTGDNHADSMADALQLTVRAYEKTHKIKMIEEIASCLGGKK